MTATTPRNTHAWNVYAEQLFSHGHGYPLWQPDPDRSAGEVEIADVGWINQGGFFQLFNAARDASDNQIRGSVPLSFERFNHPKNIISGPHEIIKQRHIYSQTIKDVVVSGGMSSGRYERLSEERIPILILSPSMPPFPAVEAHMSFRCGSDSGALLINGPTAHTRELMARMHIEAYMRRHFSSWVEFANSEHGLGLKDEDIYFVYGTTKTSNWAVAAFNGNYKHESGTITANLGSLGDASVDFSFSITNQNMSNCWHRTGRSNSCGASLESSLHNHDAFMERPPLSSPPDSKILTTPPPPPAVATPSLSTCSDSSAMADASHDSVSVASWQRIPAEQLLTPPSSPRLPIASQSDGKPREGDQCIFMRYFKMKRRKFLPPRLIKAAAGPHELPRPEPEYHGMAEGWTHDATENEDEIESVPGLEKVSVSVRFSVSSSHDLLSISHMTPSICC